MALVTDARAYLENSLWPAFPQMEGWHRSESAAFRSRLVLAMSRRLANKKNKIVMANERIRDPRCETCVFRRLQEKIEKQKRAGQTAAIIYGRTRWQSQLR